MGAGVIPQPFIQMEYKGYNKLVGGTTLPVIRMHDNMTTYDLSIGQSFSVFELDNYWRRLHYSFEPVLSTGGTLNMTFGSVSETPNGVLATFTVIGTYTSIPGVLVNGNMQTLGMDFTESAGQITFIGEVPAIDARVEPVLLN